MKFLVLLFTLFIISACTERVSQKEDEGQTNLASSYEKQCSSGECPCSTPLGIIKHGNSFKMYSAGKVSCGGDCNKDTVTVTCENGKLSENSKSKSFTCEMESCKDCRHGVNLVRHGESVLMFAQSVADCSQSCDDFRGERRCNNGVFEGGANFTYSTCQSRLCECTVPDTGFKISIDGSLNLYSKESAECGHRCEEYVQSRSCQKSTDGKSFVLTGDNQYKHLNCKNPTGCKCPLPGGAGEIANGENAFIRKVKEVKCGSVCPADAHIPVSCNNGVLTNSLTKDVINIATSEYKEKGQCSVAVCKSCGVDADLAIPHGQTFNFFEYKSPTCGTRCDSVQKKCEDGVFKTDVTNKAHYAAKECKERDCKCALPDDNTVSITYPSEQALYKKKNAVCGESCENLKSMKTCTEYNESGAWVYRFPEVSATPYSVCIPPRGCECTLPSGAKVVDKTEVTLFKEANGTCERTCSNIESVKVRCDSGSFKIASNSQPIDPGIQGFKFECKDATCDSCTLEGYGLIPTNTEKVLYSKEVRLCTDPPIVQLSSLFKCVGRTLYRNGVVHVGANTDKWFSGIEEKCTGCLTGFTDGGPSEIAIGQSRDFFKYSSQNPVGNSCGVGCKKVTRTCLPSGQFDGIQSELGDYKLSSCTNTCNQEGGGGSPKVCLLPWQNTWVTPDSVVPMFSKRKVACGDSCANYMKVGRCDMKSGRFDLGFDHMYPSCTEDCP